MEQHRKHYNHFYLPGFLDRPLLFRSSRDLRFLHFNLHNSLQRREDLRRWLCIQRRNIHALSRQPRRAILTLDRSTALGR
jgi:hypothetical protein